VDISSRTQKMIDLKCSEENEECVEEYNDDDNLQTVIKENGKNEVKFGLVFNNKLVLC